MPTEGRGRNKRRRAGTNKPTTAPSPRSDVGFGREVMPIIGKGHDLIDHYLTLERIMIEADEHEDESFADFLRDLMDSIWYQLSDEEYGVLNNRNEGVTR